MAPSPLRTITRKPARSTSLPSRSHPFMPQFEEHLFRVRVPEAAASTLSSMSSRIADLNNLYDCMDDVLRLPHIQQAISQECLDKWADELLDGYLRLLDACSTTRDIFSQMNGSVQQLLSALRRKDTDQLSGYLSSRRNTKKIIQKSLKDLRSIRNRQSVIASEKDNETEAVLSMLREVESTTLIMFDSFLSHFNGTKIASRKISWSLVSKLMNQNKESSAAEFEMVDAFISQKISNMDDVEQLEEVQNQLGNFLTSIQAVEEELECLFRSLIKSRVFLLNILNH